METLVINVPDNKAAEVKKLLGELGVTIQDKTKAKQLAEEIDAMVKPGPKLTMEEIVAEVKKVRLGK
jgi:hypothetical protein